MSPEDILECLKLNLGNNVCPSVLLELAEEFDVTPRLLESEEAAFLVPYYNLVTEIKRLIGIDDKDQFASFLIANRELVQKYSPVKVLLDHGADADLSFSGFGTPLWNAVDAFSLLLTTLENKVPALT
uniref:Uncharacterized protein n=1 Tax=Chenopodium quinoa TaxID=63459 RepID=A0A803MMZ8_CHEQI